MSSPSQKLEGADPQVTAAMRDLVERRDPGESVDFDGFIAGYPHMADHLRSIVAGADQAAGMTSASAVRDVGPLSETVVPASPGEQSTAPQRFGRYEVIRLLGRGAMGSVYLAHDTQLSRSVALKMPRFETDETEELLQRFYREARSAALLRSPHICPVYDVGEIEGQHYISMAFIEGRPLSDLIRQNQLRSQRQIVVLVRKLAIALQLAHDQGIVHRDLKPGNVMIDTRGEPVVTDFGLACQLQDASARLTNSGVILGTPAYMAPEQFEGCSANITPAADQYALGIILYELLTGQLPFAGSFSALVSQALEKAAPSPRLLRPDVDPRLESLCLKMLAKSPSDRFESMQQVAAGLAAIIKEPGQPELAQAVASAVIAVPVANTMPPSRGVPQQIAGLVSRGELEAALEILAPLAEGNTGKLSEWAREQQSQIREQLTNWRNEIPGLCRLASKLNRKHDYAEAAKVLSAVPIGMRTTELAELLREAEEKDEESLALLKEIENAIRQVQPQELPRLIKRFLYLKPGHRGIQALAADLKLHGAEKAIRLRRGRRHLFDAAGPASNPLRITLCSLGVLVFCGAAFWIGSLLMTPKGTVVVAVLNPRVSVDFDNAHVTSVDSGRSFRIKADQPQSLKVELDGIVVEVGAHEVRVKKNEIQRITARLVDDTVQLEIVRSLPGATVPEREVINTEQHHPSPDAIAPPNPSDEWIDLLGGVDVAEGSNALRTWVRGENGLTGTLAESENSGWAVLVPPLEIAGDYDLEVDYTVVGSEYLQLGMPLGDVIATLSIGNTGTGLHWIDGKIPAFAPPFGSSDQKVRPGVVQHVTASVRHDGENVTLSTTLDGEPAGRYTGLRSRVTTPKETAPAPGHLKLVTQFVTKSTDSRFEVHKARVRLLSPTVADAASVAPVMNDAAKSVPSSVQADAAPLTSSTDSSRVIIDADFRKSAEGFALQEFDHILSEHVNGEYRYVGKMLGWQCGGLHPALWDVENNQIQDFAAEADVRIVGAKSGVFGLEFGRVGDDTLTVCLNQSGQIKLIQGYDNEVVPFTATAAMRPVSQFNTIGLSVDDKVVRVTANGSEVFTKKLERYAAGRVSLWVGGDEVPFDVRLRRFRLERIGDTTPRVLTQEVRRLKGHTDIIRGVEFLPDSHRAVSVGHNKAFKLWDVVTGELLHDFEGHPQNVTSVSVSGDGQFALTGCDDGQVRLWNLEDRTLVRGFKGHSGPVLSVKISRDAVTGLSSSTDGTIRRWNLRSGGKPALVPGPAGESVLAVSPAEDVIASGYENGGVLLRSPSGVGSLVGHGPGLIEGLAFTSDGAILVTGSNDGTVRIWDVQNGKVIHRLETTGVAFDSVAITSDDRYVIAGCGDFSIMGWDIETGDRVFEIHAETPATHRMALSPDNRYLLSGGGEWGWRTFDDYDLRLWNVPAPVAPSTP